jgi:cystathionine beta-lyase/cystathionine gamma-synthase
MDNPTRLQLEDTLFGLECINLKEHKATSETSSFVFASGLAGVTSIILAHTAPLTVLLPHDLYHGVSSLLLDIFSIHNVIVQQVDMRNVDLLIETIDQIDRAQQIIVWMETPSNPKCHVIDIQAICNAVKNSSHVITTVVDGTMASPILTRPLEVSHIKVK